MRICRVDKKILIKGVSSFFICVFLIFTGCFVLVPLANANRVISVAPFPNTHGALLNTDLTVNLDHVVDPLTVNSGTFAVHGCFHAPVYGFFTFGISDFVFNPDIDFYIGEQVSVTVTSGIEVGGLPVIPYIWQFRTLVMGGTGFYDDSMQELGDSRTNGAALGDLDGDGDLDAFFSNRSAQPNDVWLNRDVMHVPFVTICGLSLLLILISVINPG